MVLGEHDYTASSGMDRRPDRRCEVEAIVARHLACERVGAPAETGSDESIGHRLTLGKQGLAHLLRSQLRLDDREVIRALFHTAGQALQLGVEVIEVHRAAKRATAPRQLAEAELFWPD